MQLDDVVHSTTTGPRLEEAMWRYDTTCIYKRWRHILVAYWTTLYIFGQHMYNNTEAKLIHDKNSKIQQCQIRYIQLTFNEFQGNID